MCSSPSHTLIRPSWVPWQSRISCSLVSSVSKEVLGRMVGRVGHQVRPHTQRGRGLGALVRVAVHVHDGGGAALERFHVADQVPVVGIVGREHLVLPLVLGQPVHQLGVLGVALEQAGVAVDVDQSGQHRQPAAGVDHRRRVGHLDAAGRPHGGYHAVREDHPSRGLKLLEPSSQQ